MVKFRFGFLMVLLVSLLSSGNVFAQTPAVKCGVKTVLQWAPNSESDLAGYRVYTSPNASDLVDVVGMGELAGVAVSTDPKLAIPMPSLVPEVDNFFVVTAYDTSDNESTPSQIAKCDNNQVPGQVQGVTIINIP